MKRLTAGHLPAREFVLPDPLPSHPRLLASAEDWTRIARQCVSDPVSTRLLASVRARANQVLEEPTPVRELEGRRLLGVARRVLGRILSLGVVARLDEKPVYTRRLIQELKAVASFEDWNPGHYLDVAELSLAVAIGYDWSYDQLDDEERNLIAGALIEKGIEPSYQDMPCPWCGTTNWWIETTNNWNQVCHAGLSAAAIAVAERNPLLTQRVIARALKNMPVAGQCYAPDGAYPEGPVYWEYGTAFQTVFLACLQKFTGSTWGIDEMPGFGESAGFIAQVTTPSGDFYDYSDSVRDRAFQASLFWFASHFRRGDWVGFDLHNLDRLLADYDRMPEKSYNRLRLLPLALLWRDPGLDANTERPLQRTWRGRGATPVFVHRSSFDEADAFYVAMKGGSPSVSHAHMDGGSFLLEADGVRWAVDLGMEDYENLERRKVGLWDSTQEGERWSVFRIGPEGHNILRFNGARQRVEGCGTIAQFNPGNEFPYAVFDLTSLYLGQVESVHRGIRLLQDHAVLFQDEWRSGSKPVTAEWQMLTTANVTVQGARIELRQLEKTMTLEVIAPRIFRVEVIAAQKLKQPFDSDLSGIQRITVSCLTEAGQSGRICIVAASKSFSEAAEESISAVSCMDWSNLAPCHDR